MYQKILNNCFGKHSANKPSIIFVVYGIYYRLCILKCHFFILYFFFIIVGKLPIKKRE